ncbi:tryptophan-rich sensory protein [candidate division KSB1 bacterium]|nr:tryptophan-rich sensory protein [candidate division KSB1 bacterium]
MNKNLLLSILNFLALLATLVVNYLANALPINGKTTGELSDNFATLFKPAGYVFSIWGIIYIALLVFVIYQLLPKVRNSELINIISIYFILSCIANIAWIFAWHHERFGLSVLIMFVLLFSLIKIYTGIHTEYLDHYSSAKWTVFVPFSLYLAWICVATIANITIYLYSINWSGFGISPTVWFVLLLLVGLALGCVILRRYHDLFFILVLIWAYLGIAVQNQKIATVSTISWAASALMIILLVYSVIRFKVH